MGLRPSLVRRGLHLVLAAIVGAVTLWTFTTPASAAANNVSGVAVWGNDQRGVPFATATLSRSGFGSRLATADQQGNFAFAGVDTGTWQLGITTPCGAAAPVDVSVPGDPPIVQVDRQHDAYGYRCQTSIQGPPTAGTPLALTGDDATASVALPFPFPLYGQEVSAITVSTNGWISATTGGSAPTNTGLPSAGHPDSAVYAFWDDLVVDASASVRTRFTASGGNSGTFEVQWLNVVVKSAPNQRLDAYVLLNDHDDSVVVYHHGVGTGTAEQGAGATVGIEGPPALTAFQVSRDQPVAVNGRAYRLVPEPSRPTADAGPDRLVPSGGSFSLDASDSSDAEGSPLTFSWTQLSGPDTPLDDPSSPRVRATAPIGPATLQYRVSVRDLSGLERNDDVVVTVQSPSSK